VLTLIILNLTFFMQVVLSATLSRLYGVLGAFHMFMETQDLGAKLFISCLVSTLVPLALH